MLTNQERVKRSVESKTTIAVFARDEQRRDLIKRIKEVKNDLRQRFEDKKLTELYRLIDELD